MRKPTPVVARDLSVYTSEALSLAAARGALPDELVTAERLRRHAARLPWHTGNASEVHLVDRAMLGEWVALGIISDAQHQAELVRRQPYRVDAQGRRVR
jgi:hypothetical protein